MLQEKGNQPVRVDIVAVPEVTPTAMYGMFEILSSVGVVWPLLKNGQPGTPVFDVALVSADGKPFTTMHGVPVAPACSIRSNRASDIIIVTDVDIFPGFDPATAWPDIAVWLADRHRAGATVCSVCTGAVLLARAGLLDGREATTHWSAVDIMAQCFPKVILKPERIIQSSGEEHRIITAGGASAWQDLLLYLIARFAGEEEARRAAKIYLLGDRSDGQLPFTSMGAQRSHDDATVARCQEWLADHYDDPSPVSRMVDLSGLPARTFKRRFKAATGYTPIGYVQAMRVEEAKQLLETTDLPTDSVGKEVGYVEPAFFRRLFKRKTGITPARYRQRFQNIARVASFGG
jgi:transcriptional regulator GlxA family with amidase domain